MKYSGFVCFVLVPFCSGAMGQSSGFMPGNLVVVQVGDGTPGMSAAAAPVFLKEIRPSDGAVIRTVALPTVTVGNQRRLTVSGTMASEGILQRSADGRYLTLAGYDAEVGMAGVSGTDAVLVNRVIARVSTSTEIDTSTAFAGFTGASIRSAVSLDGSRYWAAGTSDPSGLGGVHYIMHGAGTSVQIASQTNNCRAVEIAFGGLFVSAMGGGFTGISAVGTGAPITAGQPLWLLPGMPGAVATSSYMDFVFVDADTVYVAVDHPTTLGGGVQKWAFDGTIWRPQYTLNQGISTGVVGLDAELQGGVPVVYATTKESLVTGTRLWRVLDTGGGSVFSVVASAPPHTTWRDVEFAPVAGPSACYANCDASTAAPVLNVADFTCYLQRFAGGHPYANCDGSTLPPVLNVADFTCFLQRFAGGCPNP